MTNHNTVFDLISKWQWYSDTFMVRMLMHLLISANDADTPWRGGTLSRGCVATSVSALSAETGMSRQRVRSCLDRLIECGDITCVADGRFTVITLVSYDMYCPRPAHESAGDEPETVDEPESVYTVDGCRDSTTFVADYLGNRPAAFYGNMCAQLGIAETDLREYVGMIVDSWRRQRRTFASYLVACRELKSELNVLCSV